MFGLGIFWFFGLKSRGFILSVLVSLRTTLIVGKLTFLEQPVTHFGNSPNKQFAKHKRPSFALPQVFTQVSAVFVQLPTQGSSSGAFAILFANSYTEEGFGWLKVFAQASLQAGNSFVKQLLAQSPNGFEHGFKQTLSCVLQFSLQRSTSSTKKSRSTTSAEGPLRDNEFCVIS